MPPLLGGGGMKPTVVSIDMDGRTEKFVRFSTSAGCFLRYCGYTTLCTTKSRVRAVLREAREAQAADAKRGLERPKGCYGYPDAVLSPEAPKSVFVGWGQ